MIKFNFLFFFYFINIMSDYNTHREILINILNTSLIKKVHAAQKIQAAINGYWTRLSLELFDICKKKQYFKVQN